MATFAGYRGRVQIGQTVLLRAFRWSVTARCEEEDITTAGEGGYATFVGGVPKTELQFDCYWDPVDNPFNAPLRLLPRQTITTGVTLFMDKDDLTQRFFWQRVLITSVETQQEVRERIRYTVSAVATSPTRWPRVSAYTLTPDLGFFDTTISSG